MATGGENFNPAYETFRKYSADLLKVIQDPEVLVWELFSKCVVTSAVVEFANNMTHERHEDLEPVDGCGVTDCSGPESF